jgi:hypothetical protein
MGRAAVYGQVPEMHIDQPGLPPHGTWRVGPGQVGGRGSVGTLRGAQQPASTGKVPQPCLGQGQADLRLGLGVHEHTVSKPIERSSSQGPKVPAMMTKVTYLLRTRADEDLRSGPLTASDTRQDLALTERTEERRGRYWLESVIPFSG